MKKKMIIAAVFVAAIAITASVAFATTPSCGCDRHHRHNNDCCPSVEVNADTNATISKSLRTRSNSGDNYVTAGFFGTANLTTGSAVAGTSVNDSVTGALVDVDAPRRGEVEVNAETNATVRTCVRTSANSGRNHVSSFGGGANATTGSSNAQTNSSTTVLGSDVYVND
ncbi:MAG: hypothetical protein A3J76_00755 [Candidatus Moranbacteria bacterium RBG_13_45_13]|nr:MAG: hypothetical protein A3J76_00755 [Candidatus Moranbacteria bacterium RBG_13_45_13]